MKKTGLVLLLLFLFFIPAFTADKKFAVAEIKEAITPITQTYMKRVMKYAGDNGYTGVIFILDTPGGLLETTRIIVQDLLNTDLDTIVYVAPQGARAGSAGVFITLAAKYAVMAPGCNIGAAHPVTLGQGGSKEQDENSKTLSKKIENDTMAFIESIAKVRKRNVDWAVRSVKDSVSITSESALSNKVIDYIASSKEEIIEKIYGKTDKIETVPVKKNWAELLLTILANPNLVYFLMILGFYGILYEIIHPGTIFSGALGALLLIIALYSMQTLPVNFAGFFLILLAFVLFVLEFFIISHGLLSIGGLVSLIIGSAMLFDTDLPFLRVSAGSIAAVAIMTASVVGTLVFVIAKTYRRKAVTGVSNWIGETGYSLVDFSGGKGRVMFQGEIWNALSDEALVKNETIQIVNVNGLTLVVKKKT